MEEREKRYVLIEWTEDFNSIKSKLDRVLRILENVMGSKTNEDFKLLNNSDVMKQLGISVSTLQKLRNRGLITFSQVGHKIFYKQKDIDKFISNNLIQNEQNEKK